MAFPKSFPRGAMVIKLGLLVLFLLGGNWACDARELMTGDLSRETIASDILVLQIELKDSEWEVRSSEEVGKKETVCTFCEELAAEAINYLQENKTQEIIDMLHKTCSQLLHFEQQCITLVDYYVPLLFSKIESMQPGDICRKLNLCELRTINSRLTSESKCKICHHAVEEVLLKFEDPETQLEIIRLLLKACNAVKGYTKKCKTMVFEYGPLILFNAEKFLEKTDICTAIRACDSSSGGDGKQALAVQ
ncbi:uncharacterized protein LOC127790199 [Diospyros lotus]|uniref:uncharacterized protein LOC127790199 n=1 Tax=Diospyros lotus TaxID=55363 RepID=UPI00225A550B|nr:uncharacterized protein LOC127790199 [Diospyros lotus]